jgi:hypothetical protein
MIHIFGESYSENYKKVMMENPNSSYASEYIEYLGRDFKLYTDLLSEHLKQPVSNYSMGGICNEHIFMLFMENYSKIKSDDIVVFGWTVLSRFLVPYEIEKNKFIWRSNLYPNKFISEQTNREMMVMADNKLFMKKQLDLIKFIDKILPNNTTIHWTWVTIPHEHSLTITKETNGVVQDFHYGEKGHEFLFNQIIEQMSLTNRVRVNLWDQFKILI